MQTFEIVAIINLASGPLLLLPILTTALSLLLNLNHNAEKRRGRKKKKKHKEEIVGRGQESELHLFIHWGAKLRVAKGRTSADPESHGHAVTLEYSQPRWSLALGTYP